MNIFKPPWRELALFSWEALVGVNRAFRRCWDQFVDQQLTLKLMLESDTAVLNEPLRTVPQAKLSSRLPAPYRAAPDQVPDEIDILVDHQIYYGMNRDGGRW